MLSVQYSPPRRGGVAAVSSKSCEATESAADRVLSSAKSSGLNSFAELTTPAAPFWNGSIFIYGASTPPLQRRGIVCASFLKSHDSEDHRNKAGSSPLCPAWFRLLERLPELEPPHRDSTTVERSRETWCSAHCRSSAPGNRARHRLEQRWCGRL